MRRKLTLLLVLLFAAVSFAQTKTEKIETLLNEYYQNRLFMGTALVAENGKIIYQNGFGYADLENDVKNSPEKKFRLGSITKQFTSMLIMQLVEKGKINLDGKLSEYVPYYRKDVGDKVTIFNLLTHTSGIPSYTSKPGFFENNSKTYLPLKDLVLKYCSDDLDFEPGEKFSYNNSGYVILGAVIEETTGLKYDQALQKFIFDPLEMTNTGYDHSEVILKDRAAGYEKTMSGYENTPFLDMSLPHAAGSMYSTVGDLFKWDRALREHKLLSDESYKKMYTPFLSNYAFGWRIDKESFNGTDTLTIISHGGGINGFNTLIYRIIEDDKLIVLLNNFGSAPLGRIRQELTNILYDKEYELPKKSIAEHLYRLIKSDGIISAMETYKQLKEDKSDIFNFAENELNSLGYELSKEKKYDEALAVLQLNIDAYPTSGNTYDSMGEVYLMKGDTANSIIYYKKSLEYNPGNKGAIEKLKELGVEQASAEVKLSSEILNRYIGEYQLAQNFIITITVQENKIFAQATDQPQFEIFPKSETEFFLKVINAQIVFQSNENNEVKNLVLFQNGREMPASKIK